MSEQVISMPPDPQTYAWVLVGLVRGDRRNHQSEPLRPQVKYFAGPVKAGPAAPLEASFWHSPKEVNLLGHGSAWALVRAEAAYHGHAIAVVRVTGGLHPFLVKSTHDFTNPGAPIERGAILDPAVEKGFNGGHLLPLSYYQGAAMVRIWPRGEGPEHVTPGQAVKAVEQFDKGREIRDGAPARGATPGRHPVHHHAFPIPTTTAEGRSVLDTLAAVEHPRGSQDVLAAELGRLIRSSTGDTQQSAGGLLGLMGLLSSGSPQVVEQLSERLQSSTGGDMDPKLERLVTSLLGLEMGAPGTVPTELLEGAHRHVHGRHGSTMHSDDAALLQAMVASSQRRGGASHQAHKLQVDPKKEWDRAYSQCLKETPYDPQKALSCALTKTTQEAFSGHAGKYQTGRYRGETHHAGRQRREYRRQHLAVGGIPTPSGGSYVPGDPDLGYDVRNSYRDPQLAYDVQRAFRDPQLAYDVRMAYPGIGRLLYTEHLGPGALPPELTPGCPGSCGF
jgi:hypothetical protein